MGRLVATFSLSTMKLELCSFSGFKIHPGHGRRLTRVDGKTVFFLNTKCYSLAEQRKNPRKIAWTAPYRRKFKKGQSVESSRKRARKVVKYQRAVGDVSAADLLKKKSESKDTRSLAREQAIRAAKEKAKKDAAARKKKAGNAGRGKGAAVPKNTKSKGGMGKGGR